MIPFSPPRIDQKTIDAVTSVLQSGWITTGPVTKTFEKMISHFSGVSDTLCVSSASAGLELILRWFGVGPGDEVILPAYTYAATANVVSHTGAKPVLVDSNPNDFNINISAIKEHITKRTKVIIPVDIGGMPCDYDMINRLVEKKEVKELFTPGNDNQKMLQRILVLSDAAHSIGAQYKGKMTGSLADITVFSFHAVKNLTTAEGGAVCLNLPTPFNNHIIYQQLTVKSLHGQSKDALAKSIAGNWEYDIIEPGFKCNMTDIQAAMGVVELKRYRNDMLIKRRYIFDRYTKALHSFKWAETPFFEDAIRKSSYHAYLLRIKNCTEKQRNEIISHIFKLGVAVNVHFKPLPLMSYYKSCGYDINDYPVAYKNYSREISLPVWYDLNDDQIDKVINAVTLAVEKTIGK